MHHTTGLQIGSAVSAFLAAGFWFWSASRDPAEIIPSGSITLAEIAAKTATLSVACTRCDRAGLYRLNALIMRHGRTFGVPELLNVLSADCPKRQSVGAYDLCGIHCPDLPAWLIGQRE